MARVYVLQFELPNLDAETLYALAEHVADMAEQREHDAQMSFVLEDRCTWPLHGDEYEVN